MKLAVGLEETVIFFPVIGFSTVMLTVGFADTPVASGKGSTRKTLFGSGSGFGISKLRYVFLVISPKSVSKIPITKIIIFYFVNRNG